VWRIRGGEGEGEEAFCVRLLKTSLVTSTQAYEARDGFRGGHHKAGGLGLVTYVQRS